MYKLSVVILSILISCCVYAQQDGVAHAISQLSALDKEAARIVSETDENKYSFDHENWLERAKRVVSLATVAEIDSFCPSFMGKMTVPEASTTIFYYLRYLGNRTSIDWIARRTDKYAQTAAFTDVINMPLKEVAKLVRPAVVHDMFGFEIADSISGRRLWLMPDLTIRLMFETLADIHGSHSEKEVAERVVFSRLRSLFSYDDALTSDMSSLPRLYTVTSSDKTVRVVTYMTVYNDMTSHCNGLVVRRRSNGAIDIYELKDATDKIKSPERVKVGPDKWYGAVYYDLIESSFNKTTYYTLLGYKSNDGLVKTRVIETLFFDNRKCKFGAPIFEHEKATYHRRIFRYSAGVNMMLRYDEKRKSIVFDHLSPNNSMFIGEYRYYGPDWSYDSYQKGSKHWDFKEDIELRNQ